ncbi:MAG: serine/threonine-protein phosphatase [Gammaproteobacteria bacterium]|nr:serine/threonine-protein phosphatase [Gammaproteobacteria bacterium]MBU1656193.1 serine/threonine-protein phosphatase [Gammaproteobacteria bacterium]MBU1960481.1 serine/threonine-protein phosphatase [Gammaproteobacteria bacterium]
MFGYRLFPLAYPRLQAAARSEIGPRRENQDNYLLIDGKGNAEYLSHGRPYRKAIPRWPGDHWRLCVIDGMGGHRNGQAFAASVAEALLEEPFGPRSLPRRRERLMSIHAALHERWHQGPDSPGSTLTWIDVRPDGLAHLAQVGDSRALLLRDGVWRQLTRDHSPAEFLRRDGRADETLSQRIPEQAMAQALGYGSFGILKDGDGQYPLQHTRQLRLDLAAELTPGHQDRPDLASFRLKRGDTLLLASDGLWSGKKKDPWEMLNGEGALPERLRALLWGALDTGASDNLTAILCQCR